VGETTRTGAADRLTIGQAARRTGLTRKALRLYEARGLLPPVERAESGYRLYSEHDLQALRFIRNARAVGLGLEEIHAIMALRRNGVPPTDDVVAMLQARSAEIERRISTLRSLRHTLAGVLDAVTSTARRGEQARLCRIIDDAAG
jgi:MerR family transcriptional regulator, copper efflux regulator